jgi:uncharacterized radical SAM protein YgiQ
MTHKKTEEPQCLPTCHREMLERGWDELDILFVSGDAYIDHPAFGVPLLARLLESCGFRVGIIAQPDWKDAQALQLMGRPKLFAAISSGAMDSMVNHYTAAKKIRSNDAYTPGGIAGKRPNRAVIAYTAAVKGAFKGLPTLIGGIEASLRRLAHYDYWDDRVRRSVLADSKADLLLYGMAETAIVEVARRMAAGAAISELTDIRGSAYLTNTAPPEALLLPSFEEVEKDGDAYNRAFKLAVEQDNPFCAQTLVQAHARRQVVINPPALPLTTTEIDRIYDLPYTRQPHPGYQQKIPAYDQIRHSITSHRGCFGGCAFCAITHHQGKFIQSRSQESILSEVDKMCAQPDFHGTISDVGGPTANMYGLSCTNPDAAAKCHRPSCLFPAICKNLGTSDRPAIQLLREIRDRQKVKHVFIASGIRYDLLEQQQQYFDELIEHHISGLLKVAPESTVDRVTHVMRKPGAAVFTRFLDLYRQRNSELGLRQGIVPYLISGHPGCNLEDMLEVALYLKRHNLKVEQVQDFTPTPGSLSTCIYHSGRDPFSGQIIHVPRTAKEKRLQKALLLYHQPEQHSDIKEALRLCRREDIFDELIGPGKPVRPQSSAKRAQTPKNKKNIRSGRKKS